VQKNPEPYMVEIFTKSGLDSERIRSMMLEKIGDSPEIYENGTQYVINHKLTLEMLKALSLCTFNTMKTIAPPGVKK
jgi:hypothetical protein